MQMIFGNRRHFSESALVWFGSCLKELFYTFNRGRDLAALWTWILSLACRSLTLHNIRWRSFVSEIANLKQEPVTSLLNNSNLLKIPANLLFKERTVTCLSQFCFSDLGYLSTWIWTRDCHRFMQSPEKLSMWYERKYSKGVRRRDPYSGILAHERSYSSSLCNKVLWFCLCQ